MASSPASAPPPTSAPAPPASSTPPPTTNASAPPPSEAAATPPPAQASAPPPATPSSPPPAAASISSPPPASTAPPSPPPGNSSSPPPAVTPSPPSTGSPSPPSTAPPSPPSTATPSPPSTSTPSPPTAGDSGSTTPATGSPPPSGNGSPRSSNGNSSSTSTGLVVGLAVGGAVLLLIFVWVCIFFGKKRRKGPTPPLPRKDDGYGGRPQSRQHKAHPPEDHAIKIPPHSSPPPVHASQSPQFPPQSPPPPMFSSGGGSGSNYSGSEKPLPPPSPVLALGFSKSTFTFQELARATDGFSDANLLGQGGFGYVHRGMLPNGKEIAVKQLKTGSGQGEREFQAEVEIIGRVHHKHLVSLVGYCIAGEKRLLVYEFVPNNTLEFHLHGKGRPTMDWSTRMKIALGSAKGLAYLHEDCHPKIIHRDIKAANILLDFKFEPKVADFGLAKFSADNNTHVSTRVMGTFGYLAPEYASSGKLTEKSDVFSFGVMLLELITGRQPIDTTNTLMDDSLVDWARPILTQALEDNNYNALADPHLQHNYNPREMAQMVASAAACIRHSSRRRPQMSKIVRALENDVSTEDLNEGVKPGHSKFINSFDSSEYASSQYNEDIKKFRKLALTTQEYTSSEYAVTTSEYGQNPSGSSSEAHTREMEQARMKRDGGI